MNDDTKIHRFERAGLGKAPYKFLGLTKSLFQAAPGAPVKAGSSCDFCGTAIVDCCNFQSADGKHFHVGTDCVRKVGDAGLVRKVAQAETAARKERTAKRIAAAFDRLYDPELREVLASKPHPVLIMANKGHTLLDMVNWNADNAGMSGLLRAAQAIEAAIKEIAAQSK
jgi:hypothetical protein